MPAAVHLSPAGFRRAFFFLGAAALAPAAAHCQNHAYRPLPGYVQLGKPDQDEGRRILAEFRGGGMMHIEGDYYLEFQLRQMPRRGPEHLFAGRMWGGRNGQGSATRVTLVEEGGDRRLLVQDGREPGVWSWGGHPGDPVVRLSGAALFAPLAQTELTAFDLQRPFFAWPDFAYEGIAKIRGRPAYQFLLHPPADFAADYPALTGVRLSLDTVFRQPVQWEEIGEGGRLLRSVMIQELKKVGERWLPESLDVRNEVTHDKTRLNLTAAALDKSWPAARFEPSALPADLAAPPPDRLIGFQP